MNIKKLILGLCAVFFLQLSASAQTNTPKVKKRQVIQQKKIRQGVRSGELTKKETIQLQKQQKKIHKHKKVAKADGVVTKKERAKIHAHQTKANKNIYRKKHN